MKKTTNSIQEHYMAAKAYLETLEAQDKELDHQYIIDNGITNPDGTVPDCIYCIEDEVVFEKANKEQAKMVEESGLWSQILVAREALKIAEAKLIKFGLSLAPAKERKILEDAAKTNYTIRLKIIDLALKLDVSTILG